MAEFFSAEELIAAASKPQLPCEPVELALNGVTKSVWVQGLSGIERDKWETSLVKQKGNRRKVDTENIRAKLATKCLVDKPGGSRLFNDAQATLIGQLPVQQLQKVYEMAQRLSGVSDEDVDELGQLSGPEAGSGSPTS